MYYYNTDNNNKVPEIKVIMWLFYDITMLGMGGYTFANFFIDNVNIIEKTILFMASMVFFGYRIYILHLDAEKKKMDNKSQRHDLANKLKLKKRI
jgi:hypothetical protein